MEYTSEQRDLIRRIGALSARIDDAHREHQAAHAAAGQGLIDAVAALTTAIRQSEQVMVLVRQHGDLWREFLDTL